MTSDPRPVVFASPEESILGDVVTRQKKNEYIRNLMAGDDEDQAAERILVKPHIIALWKKQDARFNQLVEETLALFEHQTLRALERNLITQAQVPTAKGAALALQVLERRKPEKWARQSRVQVQAEVDVTHHLSDLLDDPEPIDASFREISEEDDGSQEAQAQD